MWNILQSYICLTIFWFLTLIVFAVNNMIGDEAIEKLYNQRDFYRLNNSDRRGSLEPFRNFWKNASSGPHSSGYYTNHCDSLSISDLRDPESSLNYQYSKRSPKKPMTLFICEPCNSMAAIAPLSILTSIWTRTFMFLLKTISTQSALSENFRTTLTISKGTSTVSATKKPEKTELGKMTFIALSQLFLFRPFNTFKKC